MESDYIPNNKFLTPDRSYQDSDYNCYDNKNFYLAGYPREDIGPLDRYTSSGKIISVNGFEFEHKLDTRRGASGSPICLINNLNVVGIHKSGIKKDKTNYGTFIGIILEELEKENIEINEIDKINKLPAGGGGISINLYCKMGMNNTKIIQVETGNYLYILFRKLNIKDTKRPIFIFKGLSYKLYSEFTFEQIGLTSDSKIIIMNQAFAG